MFAQLSMAARFREVMQQFGEQANLIGTWDAGEGATGQVDLERGAIRRCGQLGDEDGGLSTFAKTKTPSVAS